MIDIEIPQPNERHGHYRFFEFLPWGLSVSLLVILLIVSFISSALAAFLVLLYVFIYLSRGVAIVIRSLHGYAVMHKNQKLPWRGLLNELEAGKVSDTAMVRPAWHLQQLERRRSGALPLLPSQLIHAVIIPTYNESREILEPTIQAVLSSEYPTKQVILVIAYEERGGPDVERQANELIDTYKSKFLHAVAVRHPHNIPGEVIGKGGNITYAGRRLYEYIQDQKIDPKRVIVTTLDADNRPDPKYLPCLSYAYTVCPDQLRSSFQPIAMFTNNIWDAPAPMRVIATGNSIYNIVLSMRPHAMRNFAAHAQGLQALIETDFWSVRTIVEDGHQFWRSYFRFDGNYIVYPLHIPIYQDAVLAGSYRKTLKAQFVQLRRWAYGASDVAYIFDRGFFHRNKVPRIDLIAKALRLTEGHVTWAAGPILVLVGGFVPVIFHSHSLIANQLPTIVSRVQTAALVGGLSMLYLSLKTLPPKPARYKRHRTVFMVLQWLYLPLTSVLYYSFAAFYSQTRLAFGRYIDKFDVTEKAVAGKK